MKKRNKLAIALAVVAVLIFAGAGVARLALTQDASQVGQIVTVASEVDSAEGGEGDDDAITDEVGQFVTAESEDGFSQYFGTSWVAADGASTLTIMDGTLVERTDSPQHILYFEVESEEEKDGVLSIEASVREAANAEAEITIIQVKSSTTAVTITCDKLSCANTYTLTVADQAELSISNWSSDLASVTGKSKDEITQAISTYAASKSPYATQAVWDGQVYIDFNENTVVTTFTLNDGAASAVQIKVDKTSGTVEVF
jgi:hypothetical protein